MNNPFDAKLNNLVNNLVGEQQEQALKTQRAQAREAAQHAGRTEKGDRMLPNRALAASISAQQAETTKKLDSQLYGIYWGFGIMVVGLVALFIWFAVTLTNQPPRDPNSPNAADIERYHKLNGPAAREEMRKTLKNYDGTNPTEAQIDAGLKLDNYKR